jgi:hypothetical protein
VSQAQASHGLAAYAQVCCLISLQQLSQVQPFLCLSCTQEPGPTINYHQPQKEMLFDLGLAKLSDKMRATYFDSKNRPQLANLMQWFMD